MQTITKEEIELIDKYFRAANYLSACQLYLLDNPLLTRPLKLEDIKRNYNSYVQRLGERGWKK